MRAALVLAIAALLAASPAAAHGPITKRFRTAPPGTPLPVVPPLAPDTAAPAPRSAASNVRPLRLLAPEASAIVLARVTATEVLDGGRLHLHRLRLERVLRGRRPVPAPAIVDVRGASTRPPLVAPEARAVVLLQPAPRLSYLDAHVPEGVTPWAVVAGTGGVVPVGTAAEWEAVERAFVAAGEIASLSGAAALDARRRLAFEELAGPSPRLAADALLELGALPAVASPSVEEVRVLSRALADRRLDPATRAGLIALVGERGMVEALPALEAAAADTPAVLDALLTARARLGAPAGREELADHLAAEGREARAAAVRALAHLEDARALADVARYATTDADLRVRVAAVEALGESRRPAGLPVLVRTFDDPAPALRQASARALLAIGGPAADEALVDLALRGGSAESKRYATLVLLLTRGRDHPAVARLAAAEPSAEVRELIEHGLQFRGTHVH